MDALKDPLLNQRSIIKCKKHKEMFVTFHDPAPHLHPWNRPIVWESLEQL